MLKVKKTPFAPSFRQFMKPIEIEPSLPRRIATPKEHISEFQSQHIEVRPPFNNKRRRYQIEKCKSLSLC
jgi:hypothetical protein